MIDNDVNAEDLPPEVEIRALRQQLAEKDALLAISEAKVEGILKGLDKWRGRAAAAGAVVDALSKPLSLFPSIIPEDFDDLRRAVFAYREVLEAECNP